jgi:hypothetical protein
MLESAPPMVVSVQETDVAAERSSGAHACATPSFDALYDEHFEIVVAHAARSVTGVIAFGAGYLVGHRSQTVVTKTVTVTAPESKPLSPSAPSPADVEVGLTPASLASASDWGRSGTRPKGATKAATSAEIAANSLLEELELLRRAERTIRSGNSQVALGLLRDLDERFPKGQLVEERAAARVMANLCYQVLCACDANTCAMTKPSGGDDVVLDAALDESQQTMTGTLVLAQQNYTIVLKRQ